MIVLSRINNVLIDSCKQVKDISEVPFTNVTFKVTTENGYIVFNEDDVEQYLTKEVAYEDPAVTIVEINKKVLELKSNGLDDKKINEYFQGISEESKKSTQNGPTGQKLFGYTCGEKSSLDIDRCISFIKSHEEFMRIDGSLQCYQQLEEDDSCNLKHIYIVMNLENDFANRAITENQFDFGMQYSQAVLKFLINSLENKILPEYNSSPYLNWIFNGGYYYDGSDRLQYFSSKYSNEQPVEKELAQQSVNKVAKQYFSFLKHVFVPNKTCVDIVEQYVNFSTEIHQVIRNDGAFPLKYNHTLEFLQQSSNFQGDKGVQVGIFLILVSYCYEHTTFGIESLKAIDNFLGSLVENGKFFNDNKEKQNFYAFFVQNKYEQEKIYDQQTIQTWIEQFYSNVDKKEELIKNKKFRLYEKLKKAYDNGMDEESKEYLKFVQKQLGLNNIFDSKDVQINPNVVNERKLKLQTKKWKSRKYEILKHDEKIKQQLQQYFNKKILKRVIQFKIKSLANLKINTSNIYFIYPIMPRVENQIENFLMIDDISDVNNETHMHQLGLQALYLAHEQGLFQDDTLMNDVMQQIDIQYLPIPKLIRQNACIYPKVDYDNQTTYG